MMNEPTFVWGETVRIKGAAPLEWRPDSLGSVCGIRMGADQKKFGKDRWLYLIEFGDGATIELPECFLEKTGYD